MTASLQQGTWQRIADVADRLRRLRPDYHNPERFYVERSEIEAELRRLAVTGPSCGNRIRVGEAR